MVLTRQLASFEELAPVEAVLTVRRDAACSRDEAVHLLRVLVATLIGTLLREVSAGPTYGTADSAGIAQRQKVLENSGLAAVADAAEHLARFHGDAAYELAVNLVLDALSARLAPGD